MGSLNEIYWCLIQVLAYLDVILHPYSLWLNHLSRNTMLVIVWHLTWANPAACASESKRLFKPPPRHHRNENSSLQVCVSVWYYFFKEVWHGETGLWPWKWRQWGSWYDTIMLIEHETYVVSATCAPPKKNGLNTKVISLACSFAMWGLWGRGKQADGAKLRTIKWLLDGWEQIDAEINQQLHEKLGKEHHQTWKSGFPLQPPQTKNKNSFGNHPLRWF